MLGDEVGCGAEESIFVASMTYPGRCLEVDCIQAWPDQARILDMSFKLDLEGQGKDVDREVSKTHWAASQKSNEGSGLLERLDVMLVIDF